MGIEERIGYRFKDPSLLKLALTLSPRNKENRIACNERLEFVGDAVIELVVREELFGLFPEEHEGELSIRRMGIVNNRNLGQVAKAIALPINKDVNHPLQIWGDCFESLIGAVYVDGGFDAAKDVVKRLLVFNEPPIKDAKTKLNEFVQGHWNQQAEYRIVKESGPQHSKEFTCEVWVNGSKLGEGTGNKRQAMRIAAEAACRKLEI